MVVSPYMRPDIIWVGLFFGIRVSWQLLEMPRISGAQYTKCCMTAEGGTQGRRLQSGAQGQHPSAGGEGGLVSWPKRFHSMCWGWIFRPGFAEAKKDSLQISVYLSGFRGIASAFPCLRLSLAGGQEKQSAKSWKFKSLLYGSFKKYLVIQQDISCVSHLKFLCGLAVPKLFMAASHILIGSPCGNFREVS